MAILCNASTEYVTRDPGAWFDPAQSWTKFIRFRYVAPSTDYRYVWFIGDPNYTAPLYAIGADFGTENIYFQAGDGVDFPFIQTGFPPNSLLPEQLMGVSWHDLAATYDANNHKFKFVVDGQLIGSMVFDASAFLPFDLEVQGSDSISAMSPISFCDERLWQRCLTLSEVRAERLASTPVSTTGLLSASALQSTGDLSDSVGGHDWSAVGAISTVSDPTLFFADLAVMGTNGPINDGKAFAWKSDGSIIGELTPDDSFGNEGGVALSMEDGRFYLLGEGSDDEPSLLVFDTYGALIAEPKFIDQDDEYGAVGGVYVPGPGKVWVSVGDGSENYGQVWEYTSDGVFVRVVVDGLREGVAGAIRQITHIGDILYFNKVVIGEFVDGIYRHRLSTNTPMAPLVEPSEDGRSWDLKRTVNNRRLLQSLDSAGSRLVDPNGTIVKTYPPIGPYSYGITPHPDGRTFWVSDGSDTIRRLRLKSGVLVESFDEGDGEGSDFCLVAPIPLPLRTIDLNGVDIHDHVAEADIDFAVNERATATFRTEGVGPVLEDTIVLYEKDGITPKFGGLVTDPKIVGVSDNSLDNIYDVQCTDWERYTDWCSVSLNYTEDVAPEDVMVDLVAIFNAYGYDLTYTPVPTGLLLKPFAWVEVSGAQAIRDIRERTNLVIRFRPDKSITMAVPAAEPAPFPLNDSTLHRLAKLEVGQQPVERANLVRIKFGQTGYFNTRMAWVADGVATSWMTDIPAASESETPTNPAPAVVLVDDGVTPALKTVGSGADFEWDNPSSTLSVGTYGIPADGVKLVLGPSFAAGDALETNGYLGKYPFTVVRPIVPPAPPIREYKDHIEDVMNYGAAVEITEALYARLNRPSAKKLDAFTDEDGFEIGQGWSADTTARDGIDGTFLIAALNLHIVNGHLLPGALWEYGITATEGETPQVSNNGEWRRLLGKSGSGVRTT